MYVYAIVSTEEASILPVRGLECGVVRTIPFGHLAALASDGPTIELSGLSRAQLIPHLLIHQQVIEEAMKHHALLPVKFGTVLANEAGIRHMLQEGFLPLSPTLQAMADRVEIEVVVSWQLGPVLREITQEEAIAQQRAVTVGKPPAETVNLRITIGKMVKESLDRRREAYGKQIVEFMQGHATDFQLNPVLADELVVNMAFLVERGASHKLDRRLEELGQAFGQQFHIRRLGPLPPYSFATVEIWRLDFAEIDRARQELGLPEQATLTQVQEAYHQAARRYHPDHSHGALTRAYHLLQDYCLALGEGGEGQNCSFLPHPTGRRFLIAVKRASELGEGPPSLFC